MKKSCSISPHDSLSQELNLALGNIETVATGSCFLMLSSPPPRALAVRSPTFCSPYLFPALAENSCLEGG